MSNNQKTLWLKSESKWKPRNLQAARITFKAKGLHLPPEKPAVNVIEQRKKEAEDRKIKAEKAKADLDAHYAIVREKQDIQEKKDKEAKRNKKPKANWLGKHLRKAAKLRGGFTPSIEDQRDAKKSYLDGKLRI